MPCRALRGLGVQNRQPPSHAWTPPKASSLSSGFPQASLPNQLHDPNASSQSSSARRHTPKRMLTRAAEKGLPRLGSKELGLSGFTDLIRPQTHSLAQARQGSGLPVARQTWSTGDLCSGPRGKIPQTLSDVSFSRCGNHRCHSDSMRETWSVGSFPRCEKNVGDTLARQTWSTGFPPRSGPSAPGKAVWTLPQSRKRTELRSAPKEFPLFGVSGFWDSVLRALPLHDAGPLAAASQSCFDHLRQDLSIACREARHCTACRCTFNYLTGRPECRYHPGQEKVELLGDGPATGMMDLSWTCCGKGAAYSIGLAMPCTRSEIPGCCVRQHRARSPAAARRQRSPKFLRGTGYPAKALSATIGVTSRQYSAW